MVCGGIETSSTFRFWFHRNRTAFYLIPAVAFLIGAAVLDKLYLPDDLQVPLIISLIALTFFFIIISIPLISFAARGDNYLEAHTPQSDEPLDIPFHGGRILEYPLNYDPDSKEDFEKVESGELVPRHAIDLFLTLPLKLDHLFPDLIKLGLEEVSMIQLRYHLHFRDRFDLTTGGYVVRKGVPLYHPHAEEVYMAPTGGLDYYQGVAVPIFEVYFTRKGDFGALTDPAVLDTAMLAYVAIQKGVDRKTLTESVSEAINNARDKTKRLKGSAQQGAKVAQ